MPKYYANIVHEKSTYRSLIDASTDILQKAYEPVSRSEGPVEFGGKLHLLLDGQAYVQQRFQHSGCVVGGDGTDRRQDARASKSTSGVETGFSDMDELTGGLHNSELIILAARPSMGKTALAMNIARKCGRGAERSRAVRQPGNVVVGIGRPNALLRRPHQRAPIAKRHDSPAMNVDAWSTWPAEISQATAVRRRFARRTVTEIAAAARRISRREERLGLIVIDYLQLIEPDNPSDPRQEQVAKIARRLKGTGSRIEVPVLCLAQVNRQAEDSREHRPRLSHLRESGAIEQDADVVMFVHREEYYRRGEEREQSPARPKSSFPNNVMGRSVTSNWSGGRNSRVSRTRLPHVSRNSTATPIPPPNSDF